jgi:hypothetical protein
MAISSWLRTKVLSPYTTPSTAMNGDRSTSRMGRISSRHHQGVAHVEVGAADVAGPFHELEQAEQGQQRRAGEQEAAHQRAHQVAVDELHAGRRRVSRGRRRSTRNAPSMISTA